MSQERRRDGGISPSDLLPGLLREGADVEKLSRLTRRTTDSGVTIAAFTRDKYDISTGNVKSTDVQKVIAVSLLTDGTLTFESHYQQWNNTRTLFFPRRELTTSCHYFCDRGIVRPGEDSIIRFHLDDPNNGVKEFFHDFNREQKKYYGETSKNMRRLMAAPDPQNGLFDAFDESLAAGVAETLQGHTLISPAANEAFGLSPTFSFTGDITRRQLPFSSGE